MKKIISITLLCTAFFISTDVIAQQIGGNKLIDTEEGAMLITYSTSQSTLVFEVDKWNELFPNNQVETNKFPIEISICLKFASRVRDCNGGIGFRCGLCDSFANPSPDGKNAGRSYSGTYVYNSTTGKVNLMINQNVDWDWLSQ